MSQTDPEMIECPVRKLCEHSCCGLRDHGGLTSASCDAMDSLRGPALVVHAGAGLVIPLLTFVATFWLLLPCAGQGLAVVVAAAVTVLVTILIACWLARWPNSEREQ